MTGRVSRSEVMLAVLVMLTSCITASAQQAGSLARVMPPAFTSCTFSERVGVRYTRRAIYVPMHDGTRLAVDILLPSTIAAGTTVPTYLDATRYWRSLTSAFDQPHEKGWLARGYAVVIADVRGTGASFGRWYIPYAPQEAKDIGAIANWIAQQRWSNGNVVMGGISYDGTTALMGPAYGSPAIKAIAPESSDFDMYTDLLWPGGVSVEVLTTKWGDLVHQLDLGVFPFPRSPGDPNIGSPGPVDGPQGARWLAEAIRDHRKNANFARAAYDIVYKDQRLQEFDRLSMSNGGVYNLQAKIMRSGVPIMGWGSWLDSGIAQGLLNRFMTWSNPQIAIVGPWTHGAGANADVFNPEGPLDPSAEARDKMVFCFLNHYARSRSPDPISSHKRVLFYFTMGEEKWHATYSWPLPGTQQRRLYLDVNHSLSRGRPETPGQDDYPVDFSASTGPDNRWTTQATAPRISYGNRASEDRKLLTYTGAPLLQDMDITGQPLVTLRAAANRSDASIFVYLEDVAPDGKVTYLTEGELRAVDRKISTERQSYRTTYPWRSFNRKDAEPLSPREFVSLVFPLQATSVLLRAGHRVRVAIAGADEGNFLRIPAKGGVTVSISVGGANPSFIELPVVRIHK
jgi:uncharacterized protein